MKTLKIILTIFLTVSVATTQAHQKISIKMETLWGSKGIITNLFLARANNSIDTKVFDYYLSRNMRRIVTDRTQFFGFSESQYSEAENWLDSISQVYIDELKSLDASEIDISNTVSSSSSMFSSTICENIGFDDTSYADITSNWTIKQGLACSGVGCNGFYVPTFSYMPLNDISQHFTITSTGFDPNIGINLIPMVKPGSTYSLRLENNTYGGDAMMLTRTLGVDASKPYYKYSFAAVLEDPGDSHKDEDKPYFSVLIKDGSGVVIECTRYKVVANPSSAEIKEGFMYDNSTGMDLYFRDWTDVVIPLNDYIGQNVTIEFIVSDCSWGGHMGYVYLDGDCLNYSLDIDSCISLANPVRELTAPEDFIVYSWTGPGVKGDNANPTVTVEQEGEYQVRMTSRGGCNGYLNTTVVACSTDFVPCDISFGTLYNTTCDSNTNTFSVVGTVNLSSGYLSSGMILVNVGPYTKTFHAPFTSGFSFQVNNLRSGSGSVAVTAYYYKNGFTSNPTCGVIDNVPAPPSCLLIENVCQNCIGSFSPEIGKTYIVSAWVKEDGAATGTVTYANPYIEISYNSGTTVLSPIYASGLIIEGWQRIYYEFTISSGTTEISFALKTSSGTAYFDDIRVHPVDAGFTSYVYDPISLKLVAVLDDNNYATFYEYDQEGTLIRTKKETARGVVTITESRESNPKR